MATRKKALVCPKCSSGYPTYVVGVKCANCDYKEGDDLPADKQKSRSSSLRFFRVFCNDGRRITETVKARSEKDAQATMRKWLRSRGIVLAQSSEPKAVFISFDEQPDYLVREGRGPNAQVVRRNK